MKVYKLSMLYRSLIPFCASLKTHARRLSTLMVIKVQAKHLSFGILDAEALRLDSDGCGQVRTVVWLAAVGKMRSQACLVPSRRCPRSLCRSRSFGFKRLQMAYYSGSQLDGNKVTGVAKPAENILRSDRINRCGESFI